MTVRNLMHATVFILAACAAAPACAAPAEVRGTWVTTTANTAIATPADTAETMRRLRAIGLNTVYVETWKNGYTQYPSAVLERTVGIDRRPNLMPQDPGDPAEAAARPARDLLDETLIEAHRNGLLYLAWFEYGFMAAHKETHNHLRRMKPEWLARNRAGSEVAGQNPFVWMNPLHPGARRFLLDLVLEAIDRYDLDGVQLDDRIVWPSLEMGYDDYTRGVYAAEHGGAQPPDDVNDPAWRQWRADKVTEYARTFVAEVRRRRPGVLVSVSPAPYPWVWEHYLCDWPKWAAEGLWDEVIPQNYRFNFDAFKKTWDDQLVHIGARRADLIAGVRVVGDGPNLSWEHLRQTLDYVRETRSGGHVHWFSRGVLDVYPAELTAYYDVAGRGRAAHPKRALDWRPGSLVLARAEPASVDISVWVAHVPAGDYRIIARRGGIWRTLGTTTVSPAQAADARPVPYRLELAGEAEAVELLVDRRAINGTGPPAR